MVFQFFNKLQKVLFLVRGCVKIFSKKRSLIEFPIRIWIRIRDWNPYSIPDSNPDSNMDPDPKLTYGRIRNQIRNFCFGSAPLKASTRTPMLCVLVPWHLFCCFDPVILIFSQMSIFGTSTYEL